MVFVDHDNFQRREGMFQKKRASVVSSGKGQKETSERQAVVRMRQNNTNTRAILCDFNKGHPGPYDYCTQLYSGIGFVSHSIFQ